MSPQIWLPQAGILFPSIFCLFRTCVSWSWHFLALPLPSSMTLSGATPQTRIAPGLPSVGTASHTPSQSLTLLTSTDPRALLAITKSNMPSSQDVVPIKKNSQLLLNTGHVPGTVLSTLPFVLVTLARKAVRELARGFEPRQCDPMPFSLCHLSYFGIHSVSIEQMSKQGEGGVHKQQRGVPGVLTHTAGREPGRGAP